MCKNFCENMHRILVLIRSKIRDEKNVELLETLSISIKNELKNTEMVNLILEIAPEFQKQLLLQDDADFKLTEEAKEYVLQMLCIAQNDLKENKFDDAYEIVDVLHVFPHVIIANNKEQTEEYWRIYVNPVLK